MKKIRYAFEALILYSFFYFFKILPPSIASDIGGLIGKTIGPHLAASRKALRNIVLSLPETTQKEQKHIVKGMWENLGRVMAEYPHLEKIASDHTQIVNIHLIDDAFGKNPEQPSIFIGAHLANWEIYGAASLIKAGRPLDLTYRAPNNPWTGALLNKARSLNGKIKTYAKSRESGRTILQAMRQNASLGILIDQKYNRGIETLFFGRPAMTNPIFVQLCQKFKCPLIPARIERLKGCDFKLTIFPALTLFDAQGKSLPVEDVIAQAHDLLESWIRDRPEQWLWLHRRWK